MTDASHTSLGELFLYMRKALLGEVTPDLRGVAVAIDDTGVRGRVIFDRALTDEMRELVSDIEGEVIADYGGLFPVEFAAQYSPSDVPRSLEAGEHWAFLRYEENWGVPNA